MFLQLSLFSLLAFVAADTVPMSEDTRPLVRNVDMSDMDIDDVEINDVPYQVSLHALGKTHCGGTILSTSWVVTAARCTSYASNVVTVRAGSTKHSSGGTLHSIDEIIRHPKYTINKFGVPIYNVALLKLTPPIDLHGTPKEIKISQVAVPTGANATITGWGATDENGTQWNTLRRVYQRTISNEACDKAYQELVQLPEAKICVEAFGGKSVCIGDEGGPVTVDNQLVGLVSWHYNCGQKGHPDVITDLYSVRDWIISTTQITD